MTPNDWVGMTLTIVAFFGMIAIYVYALHPSNREKLEAQRFIPLDEDGIDMEGKK
jgi:cbb3-type cytochrome oxidase subunit 3